VSSRSEDLQRGQKATIFFPRPVDSRFLFARNSPRLLFGSPLGIWILSPQALPSLLPEQSISVPPSDVFLI